MLALLLPVLTACGNGAAGFVSGKVVDANGARVVVVSGYGLALRGLPVDGGVTVGFTSRTYVYPGDMSGLPDPGRYAGWVPLPDAQPVAWRARSIGLDLKASTLELGLSLGYLEETVMAYLPASADLMYSLRFVADDPAATMLVFCPEGRPCVELWP